MLIKNGLIFFRPFVSFIGFSSIFLTPNAMATANNTQPQLKTPIKHIIVIFQENVSFDHYFGVYPTAKNLANEPHFIARKNTPTVNGLNETLLTHNPNSANPTRLNRSEALTCDQDHRYGDEQRAFNAGLMNKFVEFTNRETCKFPEVSKPNLVMDYYDGNTVTALWNYAQYYSLSDNYFNTTFGPSTPGALNLISGQTWGAISTQPMSDKYGVVHTNKNNIGTVINDPDPTYDDCSGTKYPTVSMIPTNKNIGHLLSAKNITWGFFQGGFKPTSREADGKAICAAKHKNIGGNLVRDYIPHHEAFQYYKSTSNPHHLAPSSVAMIGHQDQANHQYDLSNFWQAVDSGNLPAFSIIKAAAYQDGHASYSDPLDEQHFIVSTINRLQKLPEWKNTAIIITYDDSDGWYDHVMPPIVNHSNDPANDALTGKNCGTAKGNNYQDRCGYGARLPLLIVSPWAKQNYVDHKILDQTSIIRFVEDNWNLGRIGDDSFDERAGSLMSLFDFNQQISNDHHLILDPATGLINSTK